MAVIVATMTACGTSSKVPLTGRTHRISISDEQLLALSNQEYAKFMASATKSTDAKIRQWFSVWVEDLPTQ